jgi:tRNA(adenine34) deaminase
MHDTRHSERTQRYTRLSMNEEAAQPGDKTRDEHFMCLAMDEARAAEAAGEVPVGAVIVSSAGEVLGRGRNLVITTSDPTAHCEIVAMREAARALGNYRLLGTTLYCTLEPCTMCAGAMIHARIARLVFAARDPKAGACGSALDVLTHAAMNHRIAVTEGILAADCSVLLSEFFRGRRSRQTAE